MKKFKELVSALYNKEFTVTDKGRIQQKEQLDLKNNLTSALFEDMVAADIEAYQVPKGFVILIPNEEEGAIPVEINIVTKPLNYDFDGLHEEWLSKKEK